MGKKIEPMNHVQGNLYDEVRTAAEALQIIRKVMVGPTEIKTADELIIAIEAYQRGLLFGYGLTSEYVEDSECNL